MVSILFFGCKKYPEDKTFIHLRRAEKRLKSGTDWKITEYKVNEVDSLPYVNSLNPWGVKVEEIKFEHLGKGGSFHIYSSGSTIYYKFLADKKSVFIAYTPAYPLSYPLFFNGWNFWQIKRLDHEVFTIEGYKNSKKYRVTFTFVE
jgi:hypothetical protein